MENYCSRIISVVLRIIYFLIEYFFKFAENAKIELRSFPKLDVTQKLFVGISSNFLHGISTSICIRKCNKNWG